MYVHIIVYENEINTYKYQGYLPSSSFAVLYITFIYLFLEYCQINININLDAKIFISIFLVNISQNGGTVFRGYKYLRKKQSWNMH